MKLLKYTLEQLVEAVKTSFSYRQVLQKLGVVPAGGNYQTLHKAIKVFELDTRHFTGMLWSKGKTIGPKRELSEYLQYGTTIKSSKLRQRLLTEKVFEHKCFACQLTSWLNKPIPLELHHIDGNDKNNRLENLQLVCPNCHTQTDTYRGRNQTRRKIQKKLAPYIKQIHEYFCIDCNKIVSHKSLRCKSCARNHNKTYKIAWPSIEELNERLSETSYSQLARELGVTDNAIRKHLKYHSVLYARGESDPQ